MPEFRERYALKVLKNSSLDEFSKDVENYVNSVISSDLYIRDIKIEYSVTSNESSNSKFNKLVYVAYVSYYYKE